MFTEGGVLLGASSLTGRYWLDSLWFNVCVCLQKVECYWVHLASQDGTGWAHCGLMFVYVYRRLSVTGCV